MNDRKEQTIAETVQAWEFGLLKFIYDKGIITEDEYLGIRRIVEMQYQLEKSVSYMKNLSILSGYV